MNIKAIAKYSLITIITIGIVLFIGASIAEAGEHHDLYLYCMAFGSAMAIAGTGISALWAATT